VLDGCSIYRLLWPHNGDNCVWITALLDFANRGLCVRISETMWTFSNLSQRLTCSQAVGNNSQLNTPVVRAVTFHTGLVHKRRNGLIGICATTIPLQSQIYLMFLYHYALHNLLFSLSETSSNTNTPSQTGSRQFHWC
jgi:hypothetical protein